MSDKKLISLISQVGSNAYNTKDNGDGTGNFEMTPAQAAKLENLLGKENAAFVALKGTHIIYRFNVAALEKAAKENKKTAAGSSIKIGIVSYIVYEIEANESNNKIGEAWWKYSTKQGGIFINGIEYPIMAGLAKDFYLDDDESEDEKSPEWNPERLVFYVDLPTNEGSLTLSAYGVTNLLRMIARRQETIG